MSYRKEVNPEYIYLTIPAEYVCVYHRIMAMLADYGEEMLKDCKANCTDKNSGVIECFNMFNAACAARLLGQDKKAQLIIIDENGMLKAFVSCNDRPRFWIDEDDLLKQNQGLGVEDKYSLDDEGETYIYPFDFECEASIENHIISTKLSFYVSGEHMAEEEIDNVEVEYYVDGQYVPDLSTYEVDNPTSVALKVVAYYKGGTNNHDYVISTYEESN